MKKLVEMVAKSLVDSPDEVEVVELQEDDETILELSVAEDDLGKVIGKRGRTVRALRTILGASGIKLDKHFYLEIIE